MLSSKMKSASCSGSALPPLSDSQHLHLYMEFLQNSLTFLVFSRDLFEELFEELQEEVCGVDVL